MNTIVSKLINMLVFMKVDTNNNNDIVDFLKEVYGLLNKMIPYFDVILLMHLGLILLSIIIVYFWLIAKVIQILDNLLEEIYDILFKEK